MQDFNDPKRRIVHEYIMTQAEAKAIIEKAYPGKMQISDESFASDKQIAAHIYHAPEFGLNPEDYEMKMVDLISIKENGLTSQVQANRPQPSTEFVLDFQQAIKNMCKVKEDGLYDSRGERVTHICFLMLRTGVWPFLKKKLVIELQLEVVVRQSSRKLW